MLGQTILCRVSQRQLMASRLMRTTLKSKDNIKTPIQEFGWEYLMKQKALKRPIAPHLQIYQPQLTWYLSGLHRITGCVMAGTLLFGGVGFALLPVDFTTFIDFVRSFNIPCAVTAIFKWVVAFPIVYHTLNGIRFLGFDLAKGTDIKSIYKSGWFVFGASIIIAAAIVFNSIQNKKNTKA